MRDPFCDQVRTCLLGSRGALRLALVVTAMLSTAPAPRACGFHSSADYSVGLLNWAYPNSLYVRTAVWMAEDAGVLPPRRPEPAADLVAFQRMTQQLHTIADQLNASMTTADQPPAFSVVLIDKVLWTHFARSPSGLNADVHTDGARPGDVVIVTHSKVIGELVGGALTAIAARDSGLVRYYGQADQVESVKAAVERAYARNRSNGAKGE